MAVLHRLMTVFITPLVISMGWLVFNSSSMALRTRMLLSSDLPFSLSLAKMHGAGFGQNIGKPVARLLVFSHFNRNVLMCPQVDWKEYCPQEQLLRLPGELKRIWSYPQGGGTYDRRTPVHP